MIIIDKLYSQSIALRFNTHTDIEKHIHTLITLKITRPISFTFISNNLITHSQTVLSGSHSFTLLHHMTFRHSDENVTCAKLN